MAEPNSSNNFSLPDDFLLPSLEAYYFSLPDEFLHSLETHHFSVPDEFLPSLETYPMAEPNSSNSFSLPDEFLPSLEELALDETISNSCITTGETESDRLISEDYFNQYFSSSCDNFPYDSLRETDSTSRMFNGSIHIVVELMTDQFGNLLFQKLLEFCNSRQLEEIVRRVTARQGALTHAANHPYGSLSVQKLIVRIKRSQPLIKRVVSALAPGFVSMMTSSVGRHVIRQCLLRLKYNDNLLLFGEAIKHCIYLATTKEGCLCIIECIDSSRNPIRQTLLRRIAEMSLHLSQDLFGNYVVQHVLGLDCPTINYIIRNRLQGNYVRLSQQKSGSHVVERCIKHFGVEEVALEILESGKLRELVNHHQGNYIVQRILEASQGTHIYDDLVAYIERDFPMLQDLTYGKNVDFLIKRWKSRR